MNCTMHYTKYYTLYCTLWCTAPHIATYSILFCTLLFCTVVFCTILFSTVPFLESTFLYSTFLESTFLYSSGLYSSFLCSSFLYSSVLPWWFQHALSIEGLQRRPEQSNGSSIRMSPGGAGGGRIRETPPLAKSIHLPKLFATNLFPTLKII